jgi:hypothetical protein
METTIHNVETGEVEIRAMNAIEIENLNIALAETEALKAELAARAVAKQALLDKLGITQEEAQLLLGGN